MKRRICVFCETWESGGIESFLFNILTHMDLSELEIDLVAECIKESVFTLHLKECGVNFIELSGRQHSLHNASLFSRLVQERRYDVVHLNLFQGLSFWYAAIAKKHGVPCRIAHSHNTALRKSKAKHIKMLLHNAAKRLFSQNATDFWACSSLAAHFMFPQETNYLFIPNGIETERFRFDENTRREVRGKLGLSDAFVIGHIGRLCYQKNQNFLLDEFSNILKKRPEAKLLLVGEGDERSALEDKADHLGIEKAVIFYGTTNVPEKLYCAMDVFVFPSRFEGLGIAAVEAQCSGLPVVCSEFVPRESNITSNVLYLSFQDDWVKHICEAKIFERVNAIELVRASEFDIEKVSKTIEVKYRCG